MKVNVKMLNTFCEGSINSGKGFVVFFLSFKENLLKVKLSTRIVPINDYNWN